MCGIAGAFLWNQPEIGIRNEAKELVERALRRLRHRGEPNYQGELATGESWVRGANRLGILSQQDGKQPVQAIEGGCWIVFNGEIYNARALGRELEVSDERIARWGDTAVVAEAFASGRGIKAFDGMFALAGILEGPRRGFLARDCFGIKPLYWSRLAWGIIFASEIKALAPESSITEITEIGPGEMMEIVLGDGTTTSVSWKYKAEPTSAALRSEELRLLLNEAVATSLDAPEAIGVYLSGGVDSAGIYSLARRHRGDIIALILDGKEGAVDGPFARRLAREVKGEAVVGECPSEGELFDLVRDTVRVVESFEPNVVRQSSVQRFIARLAQDAGVKVVLCGEGADELFCGYPEFQRSARWAELRGEFIGDLSRTQLQRVDRMGMLFTTEVRVPYLRHAVAEAALACNHRGSFLRSSGIGPRNKLVLREALEGVVPEWIRSREKVVLSEGVGLGGNDRESGLFAQRCCAQMTSREAKEISSEFKEWNLCGREEAYYFRLFQEMGYAKWAGSKRRVVANAVNSVSL